MESILSDLEYSVLKELADGRSGSGTDLGKRLGVSRTAVWKAVGALQSLGFNVKRSRLSGYSLDSPLELLDVERIKAFSGEKERPEILVLRSVGSTNDYLLGRAAGCSAVYCFAEIQTQGRGRRGREWLSEPGRSLTFSLRRQFDSFDSLNGLSLVCGLAIRSVVQATTSRKVELKWPNDIYIEGKKAGGVLVDVSGDLHGPVTVVVGIGLNLNLSEDVIQRIDRAVTNLDISRKKISRNQLAAELVSALEAAISRYQKTGFASFKAEWDLCDFLQGRVVSWERNGKTEQGWYKGVNDQGIAIVMDHTCRKYNLVGGEISVRAQDE